MLVTATRHTTLTLTSNPGPLPIAKVLRGDAHPRRVSVAVTGMPVIA